MTDTAAKAATAQLAELDRLLVDLENALANDRVVSDYLLKHVLAACADVGVTSVMTRPTRWNSRRRSVKLERDASSPELLDALFDAQAVVLRELRGRPEDDQDHDDDDDDVAAN